jgi:hypothetical protein
VGFGGGVGVLGGLEKDEFDLCCLVIVIPLGCCKVVWLVFNRAELK